MSRLPLFHPLALAAIGVSLGAAAPACSKDEAPKPDPSAAAGAEVKAGARVEWVKAPAESDITALVQREAARAKADQRTLIVYVGAAWCDPCERFHQAALAGQLDAQLGGFRFLAFDLDRDNEALFRAGYGSKMIPLFVIPREDGSPSPARMEGGYKGEGAAMELTGRLLQLVGRVR